MLIRNLQVAERHGVLRVLVVDPAPDDARRVREVLQPEADFRIQTARDIEEAGEMLDTGSFDAALVDHLLWNEESARLVRIVRERHPDVAVVLITNGENDREALPALKLGAHDFLSRQHLDDANQVAARILAAVEESRSLRRRDTMVRWLEREARTDHLTGLYNRRAFDDRLREVCDASRRTGTTVALIVMDLAGTRMVNEAHGHATGDAMIRRTASAITRCIRGHDFAARIGGDDFGVILPEGDLDLGRRVARRIAQELERINAAASDTDVPITVTFGVASAVCCDGDDLFAAADQQLSEYKSIRPVLRTFRPVEDSDGPHVA